MAQQLLKLGSSFQLHYSAHSPARMAFRQFITSSPLASKTTLHYTHGRQPRTLNLKDVLHRPEIDTHLYVCGPPGFIGAVLDCAREQQWSDIQLHREYFVADSSAEPQESVPFRIRIASSGAEFEVPADQTVVSVLLEAGIVIPTFCEQGTCGTCLTRVIAGIPDHRDVILTEAERARADQFTPCCSRSKSPLLVLDL
jgi:vanillate O-demethylase ferredoxin subunit